MQIDDAKDAFVLALQGHPIAQRAKIVSKMYVAGGLCAAKNSLHSDQDRPIINGYETMGIMKPKIVLNTPVKTAIIKMI